MLPVFGKRLFYGALWWTNVALHLVLLQIQNQRLYWSQVKIREVQHKKIQFLKYIFPDGSCLEMGIFLFFLSHMSKLLWQNAGVSAFATDLIKAIAYSHFILPYCNSPPHHVNFFKKAQISFTQCEKESCSCWDFINRGQRHYKVRIHSLRKKNIQNCYLKGYKKTWKEMEASLCVMRIVVYCIRTGPCGLKRDWFTTWLLFWMTEKDNKCNSNTVFMWCWGGGTSLVPFYCCLGIESGSGAYSEKKKRKQDESLCSATIYKYV